MTRSERLIAEHLAKNPLDAAFLPAGKLSELVGVSESSILRFARSLGYANYPDLQQVVQDEVRRGQTRNIPERLQQAAFKASGNPGLLTLALQTDVNNLLASQRQLDAAAFAGAASLLAGSRLVFVAGMRGAAPLAHLLGYALNLLRPGVVELAQRADMFVELMADVGPSDVLVGYAFSRQSAHTIAAADLAVARGAAVVAVTDDPLSPIARRAKHTLVVATQSEAFIQSYTAAASVTHALLAALGSQLEASAMKRLALVEEGLGSSGVFYREE
jgi:DNA-binding MurR/RpiR family transcriptional regulator